MEAVFVIGLLIPLFLFTVHHMPHLHDQPHAHLVFTYLCGFLLFVLHYIPQCYDKGGHVIADEYFFFIAYS